MKNCVYRFLNKDNEIIYIGKATNLKNRIATHNHLPKSCYDERVKIEYIAFENEYEMDFAERYFIPKYKPKYNIILCDRVMSMSLSEFDNKVWLSTEEYEKIQTQKRIEKQKLAEQKRIEKQKLAEQKRIEKQKLAEQKRIEKQKLAEQKLNKIKNNIEWYIRCLEDKNDIKINIDTDDYDINIETYRDFYSYIEDIAEKKINEKKYYNYNNRRVMCTGSGEIFNNLIEYEEYMETNASLEVLSKVASDEDRILLGTYHPKYYKVFSRPVFVDVFEKYNEERQKSIKVSINQDIRSIICLTDGQVYKNKHHANDETGLHYSRIIDCCNNYSNYAGTFNDKPLVWKWYDEYLNMTKDEIKQYIDKATEVYVKRNRAKSS